MIYQFNRLKHFLSPCFLCIVAFVSLQPADAATLNVPTDYTTIQGAINAASSGDLIVLDDGGYNELLTINKSVEIRGSSPTNCIIFFLSQSEPIVSISGGATVKFTNLEIAGGTLVGEVLWYTSPAGIVCSNATLFLDHVYINGIRNFMVTVINGALNAYSVSLCTRTNFVIQCDVGFQLNGCIAKFENLRQEWGHIDHTININNPPANFSEVAVLNSTIRSSKLSWGDCIRTFIQSSLIVRNCNLYRPAGGEAGGSNHTGISINGPTNTLFIRDNTFDGVPWGLVVYGADLDSNQILVEGNTFTNCELGGIAVRGMDYLGLDLGGGKLGSTGGNIFRNIVTNDVVMISSSSNVYAVGNTWSSAVPDTRIWDRLDDPALGRVITLPIAIRTLTITPDFHAQIQWNDRGIGELFTLEMAYDLEDSWVPVKSPNAWPTTNAAWYGRLPESSQSATFYRLKAIEQ